MNNTRFAAWRWLALCGILLCISGSAASQPFPLTSYDIYGMDVNTGRIFQITHVPDMGEFNPSWSNDGKFIVHDVVFSGGQNLAITNVGTGETVPLAGGEGANDGRWSPNGQWIAFDDFNNIYILPPGGGTRRLVVSDAATPRWSPNSKRIVFVRPSDGSMRTIDISGTDERLTLSAGPFGGPINTPAWSSNGQWIAFMTFGFIVKVPVDNLGQALGDFQIVADFSFFNYSPAWSNNSKTIVFGRNNALWTIPASGSEVVTQLTTPTAPFAGDYDPAYSNNGQLIAFARATLPFEGSSAAQGPGPQVVQQDPVPTEFGLGQNFPNPFNPTATIRYALPTDANVSLEVYNALGQRVAQLVDQPMAAGYHDVVFNASQLASGIYIYKIQAGSFVQSRKMILLK